MDRYTPVRGMIVCSEGGDYVLYEDHIACLQSIEKRHNIQVAELEKEIKLSQRKLANIEQLFSRYFE